MSLYQTCRLCKGHSRDEMVQYGVRHYAHHDCYLKAGKSIDTLHDWQLKLFPYRLFKEYGLLPAVEKRLGAL